MLKFGWKVEITFATQARGSKQYELTDHLGNIRTVVPDIKEPLSLPQNQNFRLPTLTLNKTTPTACCRQGVVKMRGGIGLGSKGKRQTTKLGTWGSTPPPSFGSMIRGQLKFIFYCKFLFNQSSTIKHARVF